MKVLKHKSAGSANHKCSDSDGAVANLGFHLGQLRAKRFEAKSAELSGLAAAGSRRLAGANLHSVAEFVTTEFAGMHGSGVVPTGSDGSPGADSLRRGDYGQGISNINVNNLVPTNGNRGEWVCYDNTFIEDVDLGANEHQVGADGACSSPEGSRNSHQQMFGKPQGDRKQQAKGKDKASQNITASRSKSLFITHVSIIAGEK
jgi:hypothetical protein